MVLLRGGLFSGGFEESQGLVAGKTGIKVPYCKKKVLKGAFLVLNKAAPLHHIFAVQS